MAYNILGISVGHNSSASLISDGNLIYYLEEERLSKEKRDGNPFRVIIDICSKYKIDELVITGTNDESEHNELPWNGENVYYSLVRKFYPKVKVSLLNHQHHLTHAFCAHTNSGFKESSVIVIDGAGSKTPKKHQNVLGEPSLDYWESESIYKFTSSSFPKTIYKKYTGNNSPRVIEGTNHYNDAISIGKSYEAVTMYLGWHPIEGGKTMGLAPYGKENPNIPPLFINNIGNRNIFIPRYPFSAEIDTTNNPFLKQYRQSKEWHNNPKNLNQIEADLAWHVQRDTQNEVSFLIENTVKLTNNKNICIVGGYGLNCVSNYWLKKKFPNLNIHQEPIAHDGGTSIGAAYARWLEYSKKLPTKKLTSLYLGPKYNLKIIKQKINNNMFNQIKSTPQEVAKLISERNIVTIFQGRSEAGPRALGNRSILYDPTDPNGKDFVNRVKKREWFRPFAGTVLLEKANEWFDMAGLKESPFMMYAMDVWPDKQEIIKAITHVDGTCRIQTVTEEQNPHYYKLIQEFEKITGVPILFNTSFNLAGDPLVETIDDAMDTLLKSEIKYLYLPELEMLLEKK